MNHKLQATLNIRVGSKKNKLQAHYSQWEILFMHLHYIFLM